MTARNDICEKHRAYHENPQLLVEDIKRMGEKDAKKFGYPSPRYSPKQKAQMRCCPPENCSFSSCDNHTRHEYTYLTVNTMSCRFCGAKKHINASIHPFLVAAQWLFGIPHSLFHITEIGIGMLPHPLRYPFVPYLWLGYKIFHPLYDCGR